MALKIFGDSPKIDRSTEGEYKDDVVGRFRSGYQVNGRPAALQAWRVTSGDPAVMSAIQGLFGGEDAQTWEASGEDNLEVFTEAGKVGIILESAAAVTQELVMWSRAGKIVYTSDGETLTYADGRTEPDPDAGLGLQERKQKDRDGMGPGASVSIRFRLEKNPDLGMFRFNSGSWSLLQDLHYYDVENAMRDVSEDTDGGPILATLGLEEVSFIAKSGPQAGRTVAFTKPTLKVQGAASTADVRSLVPGIGAGA